MDYLAVVLTIFLMGLQAYFARGGQGGTLEARRQRYERAPQQPVLAAAGSDVFVTLRESTHLSHSLFQRLQVVEQLQDEQAVKMAQQDRKMAGQEREIMLLKQQNQELQDITSDQDTVIKIQSSKIERHERQITKLRALLKELGKEITDEELEKMANETAT